MKRKINLYQLDERLYEKTLLLFVTNKQILVLQETLSLSMRGVYGNNKIN